MSRAEYRPIPADELDGFLDIVTYAFRPEAGPEPDYDDIDVESQPGDPYGMFVGDELRSVCRHYWFTATVRGMEHDVAGLSLVATPPEHRRRGYVADMLGASLDHYRERDVDLSVLWPFKTPFYRRFGWGVSDALQLVECAPDAFGRLGAIDGRFERVEADDWRDLEVVDAAFANRYERMVALDEDWYRHRVFDWWGDTPYVYVFYQGDTPRGYLTYRIESSDERELHVRHLRFANLEAFQTLVHHCRVHEDHVESVRFACPDDVPVLDMLDEPNEAEVSRISGCMYRIVDVERLLDGLASRLDTAEPIVIDLRDPIAPWNDDTFVIEVDDGRFRCRPTEGHPDVSCDIASLTQLFVGHRTAETLATLDQLDLDDAAVIEPLSRLFPPRRGTLLELF